MTLFPKLLAAHRKNDVRFMTDSSPRVLRAVELYCGIGGLHCSLKRALADAVVVASYDVNPLACDTYAANFGRRPSGKDIRSLSAAELDAHAADLWLLSPPCQPYTRNGLQRDKDDGRASSLLSLLQVLRQMRHPPSRLLLENVVGFETSEMRQDVLAALSGYTTHEFVLSPTQCGVPISRPRYFLLAVLQTRCGPDCKLSMPLPVTPYPHLPPPLDDEPPCKPLSAYLDDDCPALWLDFAVPWAAVRSSLLAVDFVHPGSSSANCVTKAYGKFAKGTGSMVVSNPTHVQRLFDVVMRDAAAHAAAAGVDVSPITDGGKAGGLGHAIAAHVPDWPADAPPLRYLTPDEIARLHGFPPEFFFPEHVTRTQRYALLGNSLSVDVVGCLLEHLLADWTHINAGNSF